MDNTSYFFDFLRWFMGLVTQAFNLINRVSFPFGVGTVRVGLGWIFIAFLVIAMFVALFWKGARG